MFVIICCCHLQVLTVNDLIGLSRHMDAGSVLGLQGAHCGAGAARLCAGLGSQPGAWYLPRDQGTRDVDEILRVLGCCSLCRGAPSPWDAGGLPAGMLLSGLFGPPPL